MTSVTFTPDVGGDNITIDDSDSATTGLGNGGHRTRFMIALAQFMKVVVWVKATTQTVLGYRDAAATSAGQALTYAGLAQAAAGVPSYAGKGNQVMTVNPGATGVQWTNAPNLSVMTLTHTQPLVRYMESDQAGAVGVFQTQVEGGAYALLRNTAAARDFSTNVAEHVVNSAGRHLFGGAADDALFKYIMEGNLRCNGTMSATVNVAWTSDGALKDDVQDIGQALSKVERMRGVSYVRNDIEDSRRFVGVIAQEMREILPEAVQQGADGYLSVDYGALTPVLIEAVKALAARVRRLEGGRT